MVWGKAKQTESRGCTPRCFLHAQALQFRIVGSVDSARLRALFTPQRRLVPAILQTAFIIEFYGFISLHCVCFHVTVTVFSLNADVNFFVT